MSDLVLAADESYFKEKWEYDADGKVRDVCVGDFDADGRKEIAAAVSVETSFGTGGDFKVINSTGSLLWKRDVSCPIYSIECSDLDKDGYVEILVGSCTHLHAFAYNQEKEWQFFTDHGSPQVVFPTDLNDDGNLELLIGAGDATSKRSNNLYLIDNKGKLIWKKGLPASPGSIAVGDINADGIKEIVVGTEAAGLGFSSYKGWIDVYGENGTLQWEVRVKSGVSSVKITDLDKDGTFEIIAGALSTVYELNRKGDITKEYNISAHAYALETLDSDSGRYLIVGTSEVIALDSGFKIEWKYDTGDETYVMRIVDINKDGNDELLTGSDKVYLIDESGKLLWSSSAMIGVKNLVFSDLEGDNYDEVIFGALNGKVYAFETKEYAKKQNAEENLQKAKDAFSSKKYEDATAYAEMARKLYGELGMISKLNECKNLLSDINALQSEDVRNRRDADESYNKSMAFFLNSEFKSALMYARKARTAYVAIKKKTPEIERSIENCETLIDNSMDGLMLQLSEMYENASLSYKNRDYERALNLSREVKESYDWVKDNNMSEKAGILVANSLYAIAEVEYGRRQMENATSHAKEALEIFTELGNETFRSEISKCNQLISRIEKGPEEIDMKFVVGGIIALLSIVAVIWIVFVIRKKNKPSKDQERFAIQKPVESSREKPKFEPIRADEKQVEKIEKPAKLEPIKKDSFSGVGKSLKL